MTVEAEGKLAIQTVNPKKTTSSGRGETRKQELIKQGRMNNDGTYKKTSTSGKTNIKKGRG